MTTSFFNVPVKDINYHVVQLAKAREDKVRAEKDYKALKALLQAAMDATLSDLLSQVTAAKVHEGVCRAKVEQLTLHRYESDGEKKGYHPAVEVRSMTVLDYDGDKALTYAREHIPGACKLDKRAFESAAKVLDLEFVDIGAEPKVYIKSNLSDYA